MLTVLSWLWAQPGGRCEYTAAHVNIWAEMVRRNLKRPHRIACVTHEDIEVPGVDIIRPPRDFEKVRIPSWKDHKPQCLRRLSMFRPDAAEIFGERFVCMDLDCVIAGPLDPLFDRPEDFVMFWPQGASQYNGSMMMLKAGARPQVYQDFTPEGAAEAGKRFVGSDQAWIMHCLGPGEATWSEAEGVGRWWCGSGKPIPATIDRILFFVGFTKPWDALDHPHIARHYRRSGRLRGLILGRGHGVWQEAEAALDVSTFDGVIALREAARHWPGRVDAVATTDDHALRLAAMLGFSDIVFCGKAKEA